VLFINLAGTVRVHSIAADAVPFVPGNYLIMRRLVLQSRIHSGLKFTYELLIAVHCTTEKCACVPNDLTSLDFQVHFFALCPACTWWEDGIQGSGNCPPLAPLWAKLYIFQGSGCLIISNM
jgi:hypothetical protein